MSAAVNLCKDIITELKRKNRLLAVALGVAVALLLALIAKSHARRGSNLKGARQ